MKGIISIISGLVLFLLISCSERNVPIDRRALLDRNNVININIDSLSPLSVGNGEFAYTMDLTGLQSFPEFYERAIPLGTMSNWGWHTELNPDSFSLRDVVKSYEVHGRNINYIHQFRAGEGKREYAASEWLRANPHKIHLGMIGLQFLNQDGRIAEIKDIKENKQRLILSTGSVESTYSVYGTKVSVITVCHPEQDLISARIESDLIGQGRLKVKVSFPAAFPKWSGYDFDSPEKHITKMIQYGPGSTGFERIQDSDKYFVRILHRNSEISEISDHNYLIEPSDSVEAIEISCRFSRDEIAEEPYGFNKVAEANNLSWENYWKKTGVVDFSGSTDPRAAELERRVVLSQYLTRIQCSGSIPPAETGLTMNSWFGKFHLEMHWWHSVHFALWNNEEVLAKQMEYYFGILEKARQTAIDQGYKGVRWPKMTDPDGRESPSGVGTYLIWQQPHPLFFSELLYRISENKSAILEKYKELVFETADFMASYAWYDTVASKYVLGPVLISAQESLRRETTINPSFELAYWEWGLKTAIEWKKRLGEQPDPHWIEVRDKLSDLPVSDGVYLCSEDTRDSWTNPRYMSDHPIIAGVKGFLPSTELINDKILGTTLDTIVAKWNWKSTWGWDYPLLAMAAAEIGREEQAVDFLLMDAPKNRYLVNGHNYQDARLPIYLPGNGGLLTAVALMCTGDHFPRNGKWKIKWENLKSYTE